MTFRKYLIAFSLLLLSSVIFAQTSVLYTVTNIAQTNANTFEYELYITNTGTTALALRGYSWGINLSTGVSNGGTMTHIFLNRDPIFSTIPAVASTYTTPLNHLRGTTTIATSGNEVNLPVGVAYKLARMRVHTTASCWPANFNLFQPPSPLEAFQLTPATGRTECVANVIVTPPGSSFSINGINSTATAGSIQGLSAVINPDPNSTSPFLLDINTSSVSITNCNAYTWPVNNQTYVASGVYVSTVINTGGCDSVLTMNLTINQSSSSSITQTACDSIVLNSQTYTLSGTYTQTFSNAVSCDSVVTLYATIHHSSDSVSNQTACDSFVLNGQTYTANGTYVQTFQNVNLCDSSITLHLTLNHSTSSSMNVTACDTYTMNSQTYTSSGVYTQTFINAIGCDSSVILNLQIKNSSFSSITQTACDSFLWNGQTYTANGTYTQTYTNALGCDSMCTLHLTLSPLNLSVSVTGNIITANATGVAYQWIDCLTNSPIPGATNQSYSVPFFANIAVLINNGICSDTSICTVVFTDGISEINQANFMTLYPNPNQGIFTLELKTKTEISISNSFGEIIYQTKLFSGTHEINLAAQADGIYFMKAISDGKYQNIKLIKAR